MQTEGADEFAHEKRVALRYVVAIGEDPTLRYANQEIKCLMYCPAVEDIVLQDGQPQRKVSKPL